MHVVIDDQNDFLHPEGWYATHDIDIEHMRRVIEPTKALNDGVPRAAASRSSGRATAPAASTTAARSWRSGCSCSRAGCGPGRGATRSSTSSTPRPEDWIVEKTRLSAFFQTNLEQILRALGAETVILTGVLTNQCVGATCKDALFRDFKPIVVEECVGTATPHLHDPAIEMIRVGWGQVNTLEQTLAELRAFPLAGD